MILVMIMVAINILLAISFIGVCVLYRLWNGESKIEPISGFRRFRCNDDNIKTTLPTRGTSNSAGYDFYSPIRVVIPPKTMAIIDTNILARMYPDEVLYLHIRSSVGKRGIKLANTVAVIDADFNESIKLMIENTSEDSFIINHNDRLVQGVFHKYLTTYDDNVGTIRTGGIGSTGE